MSNKRKFILIASTLFAIVITSIIIIFVLLSTRDKKVENIPNEVVSSAVSYTTNSPSNISKKRITNYISGGSSFYCSSNPTVCQKIQTYYYNINSKNFEDAYSYGSKLRSYDSLVSTYQEYKIVSASYVREQPNGSFDTYVTLIKNTGDLELFKVNIVADENYILSSVPTSQGNQFDLDCNYVNNVTENNVCVFKIPSTDDFANLIANSFFYLPEYVKGMSLNAQEKIYYNGGGDGLSKWAIIYKYNSDTKILTFVDQIRYQGFPDIDQICSDDLDQDLSSGGCAEHYLNTGDLENDRHYQEVKKAYQLNIN